MEISKDLERAAQPSRERIRQDLEGLPAELRTALRTLEEHLFHPALNVTWLMTDRQISRGALRRLATALGISLHAYIENHRMETASRLLAATSEKIQVISAWVGFSSIQVFSRAFMRWSGERPSAYRRISKTFPKQPLPAPKLRFLNSEETLRIQAEELLLEIRRRSPAAQESLLRSNRCSPALIRFLLDEGRLLRSENVGEAIQRGRLATLAVESMGNFEGAPELRADSWIELAESYRAAGDLDAAEQAIQRAEGWTGGLPIRARARFLIAKAALLQARGAVDEALALLDHGLSMSRKDRALAGELFTHKGALLSAAGRDGGIALIEHGLMLTRLAEEET